LRVSEQRRHRRQQALRDLAAHPGRPGLLRDARLAGRSTGAAGERRVRASGRRRRPGRRGRTERAGVRAAARGPRRAIGTDRRQAAVNRSGDHRPVVRALDAHVARTRERRPPVAGTPGGGPVHRGNGLTVRAATVGDANTSPRGRTSVYCTLARRSAAGRSRCSSNRVVAPGHRPLLVDHSLDRRSPWLSFTDSRTGVR
jgi:hypothetical protein